MRIAGMQKLTLLDYPGLTAATVFTPGCNLRCPFCHNGELVDVASRAGDRPAASPELSVDSVLAFLRTRRGLLDGVCISGGEPLLQPELADFCLSLRKLGFSVKLDTNGTFPDRLRELLNAKLLDYVALDVKSTPAHYAETAGCADLDTAPVLESLQLLMTQGSEEQRVPYELRTTIVRELHAREDLVDIARWIVDEARSAAAPTLPPWFIQNFKDSDTVLAGTGTLNPWKEDELRALVSDLRAILPTARLRGTIPE